MRTAKKYPWMPEVKAAVWNRRFLCGGFLLALAFLAAAYPYRSYLIESGGSSEGPAWICVFLYSISSGQSLLFLPLFVPLASAGNIQEELKSRYALFLVSRAGRKPYLAGKAAGAALSGGLTAAIAAGAALAVIIPWCAGIPDVSAQAAEFAQAAAAAMDGPASAVQTAPGIRELLSAFACCFLNGALWSLAGSLSSVLGRNPYLGYAVPFVLYYVLTVFQERYYEDLYFLSPRQWAYPSFYGAGVCAAILLGLMAVLILFLVKLTERRLTG